MIEENEDGTYEVVNSDGHILKFTGELVAHVSSELPEKERFTSFSLYLSDFNTWILQGIGHSRIPGETDRRWYVVSSDSADIIDKIVGDDVSRLAKRLIRDSFNYLKNCEPLE